MTLGFLTLIVIDLLLLLLSFGRILKKGGIKKWHNMSGSEATSLDWVILVFLIIQCFILGVLFILGMNKLGDLPIWNTKVF